MTIRDMQNLNRATMEYVSQLIVPGMNLCEVRRICEEYMLSNGADSFWYWNIGAFVFSGENTAVSVSGKEYETSCSVIRENELITIDLSPQCGNIWGDYARTIIVENGKTVANVNCIKNDEWRSGVLAEDILHNSMRGFVTPDTTFEELFYFMNGEIKRMGYVNLDFLGNLGHSIEKDKSNRIYIEKGVCTRLSDVMAFTFEPHIGLPNSPYGFKKENIYCFENGVVTEL